MSLYLCRWTRILAEEESSPDDYQSIEKEFRVIEDPLLEWEKSEDESKRQKHRKETWIERFQSIVEPGNYCRRSPTDIATDTTRNTKMWLCEIRSKNKSLENVPANDVDA